MTNLIQTALEQGWTIGELNKRIKEQSSLKDDKFLDITRGDLSKKEVAGWTNIKNNPRGSSNPNFSNTNLRTRSYPLIDATSHNLTKFTGRV